MEINNGFLVVMEFVVCFQLTTERELVSLTLLKFFKKD